MPIQCKVAQILSSRELVITAGSTDGVKKGMVFHVMGEIEIKDPDSGEKLDEMPFTKVRLKASVVRPRVSIAETFGEVRDDSISRALRIQYSPPEHFEYVQNEGVKGRDATIYVGDLVIQYVSK